MKTEDQKPPEDIRELFKLLHDSQLPDPRTCIKLLVEEVLLRTEGNQAQAARLLGLSPQAINARVRSSRKRVECEHGRKGRKLSGLRRRLNLLPTSQLPDLKEYKEILTEDALRRTECPKTIPAPPKDIGDIFELLQDSQLPALKTCIVILIEDALRRTHGNQVKAGKLLGLSRQAVNKRLRRMRLECQHDRDDQNLSDVRVPLSLLSDFQLPELKKCKEILIEETLRRTDGSKAKAARMLGLSRQALSKHFLKRQVRI